MTQAKNTSPVKGTEVIAHFLKNLPNKPGVYRMLDSSSNVLYVGKARSLKKRVQSYTRLNGHTTRIQRMIAATCDMEFITTSTEAEALLLEANLIKSLKPQFNVLLRDDKSFPYILVSHEHEAPQILKHRGNKNVKGDYFGPFASAGAVNRTLNTLQRAFLLRTCSDSVYENRSRPCLLYQIKRCSAPCTSEISTADYQDLVEQASSFLKGNSDVLRKKLQSQMEEASSKLEYEKAAEFRNRLTAISQIQQNQEINHNDIHEADVFAAYQEGGQTCIQVFFFRIGQNWGNRSYFPRADKSLSPEEILDAFIAQFYASRPVPKLILLSHKVESHELIERALSEKTGQTVKIHVPFRGSKIEPVKHALANAKEALARKLSDTASQTKLLKQVSDIFKLPDTAERIEVYDNSHIQGEHAVGAMIVSGPEGFLKSQYRKFNIKSKELTPGDDFAMMREVITRRFKRLLKETPEKENTYDNQVNKEVPDWPDLILIDGGKGQLSSTLRALEELGIRELPVAAISKGPDRNAGREEFHLPGNISFTMELKDPALYFIQRLRDEAHRFAIGSHRARRKKAISDNPLNEIPGVGPTRKKSLLKHFGSAKSVSRAGIADLQNVEGISQSIAETIYNFFHDDS